MNDCFSEFFEALEAVPAWVPFAVFLPLSLAFSAALRLRKVRKFLFPALAVFFGGGICMLCYSARHALLFGGAFFACCGLGGAFLLPKRRREKKSKAEREEELYRKLCGVPPRLPKEPPAKVCRFEEPPPPPSKEYELRLTHAEELLARLRTCELTPSDRLETESLSRILDGCRGALSEPQVRSLNDCLASVLKLTAKYKL